MVNMSADNSAREGNITRRCMIGREKPTKIYSNPTRNRQFLQNYSLKGLKNRKNTQLLFSIIEFQPIFSNLNLRKKPKNNYENETFNDSG